MEIKEIADYVICYVPKNIFYGVVVESNPDGSKKRSWGWVEDDSNGYPFNFSEAEIKLEELVKMYGDGFAIQSRKKSPLTLTRL